jgi:hypothetical protein
MPLGNFALSLVPPLNGSNLLLKSVAKPMKVVYSIGNTNIGSTINASRRLYRRLIKMLP